MTRRFDQALQFYPFSPVGEASATQGRDGELTLRHLAPESPVEFHVLSAPVILAGEAFLQCSCGLIVACEPSVLVESCPLDLVDAEYRVDLAKLDLAHAARRSQKLAVGKVDAQRFARLRVAACA